MAIKRTALDALFSDLIREGANWTCECCGSKDRGKKQCAHIISRKVVRLRHDPLNAVCLCAACHAYFTDRPSAFGDFVKNLIGPDDHDWLVRTSNEVHKRPKGWEKDARAHYRKELKTMREKRAGGVTQDLQFEGYW